MLAYETVSLSTILPFYLSLLSLSSFFVITSAHFFLASLRFYASINWSTFTFMLPILTLFSL